MQISEASINKLAADPAMMKQMSDDPAGTLKLMQSPLETDTAIYRIVVIVLGAVTLMATMGALTLAFYDKPTPDTIIAIGSGALGALAALLKPSNHG